MKHKLDFRDSINVFDAVDKVTSVSFVNGEERFLDMALYSGRLLSLVYTKRDDSIRIISFRIASRKERKRYDDCIIYKRRT